MASKRSWAVASQQSDETAASLFGRKCAASPYHPHRRSADLHHHRAFSSYAARRKRPFASKVRLIDDALEKYESMQKGRVVRPPARMSPSRATW